MSSETAPATPVIPAKISALIIKPTLSLTSKMADLYRQRRKETLTSVSLAEAVEQIATGFQGVLLISLAAEGDIVPISSFFKTLQADKLSARVHVIIISKMNNVKIKHAFMRMGASEFLQDSVTASTLFFRTVYFISQLQSQNEKPKEESSKRYRGGGASASADNDKITVSSFQTSSDMIGDDTWLIRGIAPKKIGVQWVVESEGPDPDSGSWEFTGLDGKRQEQWTWRPHDSNGYPLPSQGENGWTFSGNRPTFQAEGQKWKFVGNEPDLTYAKDGKKAGSKIKTDPETGMILAADNEAAEGRIKASQAIGELVKKRREEEHRQAEAKAEAEKASRTAEALTEKEILEKKRRTGQAESDDEHALNQKTAMAKSDVEKEHARLSAMAGNASNTGGTASPGSSKFKDAKVRPRKR